MKNIEIDEQLYQFIAQNTQYIGESASEILRRLLSFDVPSAATSTEPTATTEQPKTAVEAPVRAAQIKHSDSVFNYLHKEELAMQRGAVGRFLLILAALHRVHQQDFAKVLQIRGRDRLYFANTAAELAASGSSTKPRQIPDCPYWVMTNSNTTRKKMILTEVAQALGYDCSDAEKIRELL